MLLPNKDSCNSNSYVPNATLYKFPVFFLSSVLSSHLHPIPMFFYIPVFLIPPFQTSPKFVRKCLCFEIRRFCGHRDWMVSPHLGALVGMHGLHWDLVVVICIRGLFSSSQVSSTTQTRVWFSVSVFFLKKENEK